MNNKDQGTASKGEGQLSYLENTFKPWIQQDFRDRIFWICEQVAGVKILDVGCGAQPIIALSLAKKGYRVIAIDPDEEAIDLAHRELGVLPEDLLERVELAHSDVLSLNPHFQFDTVILGNVLQDFDNPEQVLTRILKFLSSDGTVVITAPYAVKLGSDGQRRLDLLTLQSIIPAAFSLESLAIVDLTIRAVLRPSERARRHTAEELLDITSRGLIQAQLHVLRKSDWLQKTIEKRDFLLNSCSYKLKFMENRVKRLETKNSKLEKKAASAEAQRQRLANQLASSPMRVAWRLVRLYRKGRTLLGKR
jgi:2-polyprenyl-3-methyl-5-hydroxy-6-metoxy-1,4-benzoquinol methylase